MKVGVGVDIGGTGVKLRKFVDDGMEKELNNVEVAEMTP